MKREVRSQVLGLVVNVSSWGSKGPEFDPSVKPSVVKIANHSLFHRLRHKVFRKEAKTLINNKQFIRIEEDFLGEHSFHKLMNRNKIKEEIICASLQEKREMLII